jgi:two-component system chemotaxis response regulator CheY
MSIRVLICDDAAFMRAAIGAALTAAGHEVVGEAATGEQAVERFRACRPDLVTMDIVMPGGSGMDAVRRIREIEPGARIVMVTAMGQEALIKQAREAGASAFLVKPFTPPTLIAQLERALAAPVAPGA